MTREERDRIELIARTFGGCVVVSTDPGLAFLDAWNRALGHLRPLPRRGPPGARYDSRGRRTR